MLLFYLCFVISNQFTLVNYRFEYLYYKTFRIERSLCIQLSS